jgi:hypothetical protein
MKSLNYETLNQVQGDRHFLLQQPARFQMLTLFNLQSEICNLRVGATLVAHQEGG